VRMNINAIKRNCKATSRAIILDSMADGQWITNGTTAWLVEGLRMTVEAVEALFNLTNKQKNDMAIVEKPTTDPRFSYVPFDGEEETEEAGAVVYQDAIYIALPSRGGMLFIPYEPIKHIKDRYRHYAVRWMRGRPMVAVYEDMFCAALVMPLDNRSAGEMREIARKLAGPTYEWPDPERDAADAEAEAEAMLARMIGEDEEGDGDNGEDEQGAGD